MVVVNVVNDILLYILKKFQVNLETLLYFNSYRFSINMLKINYSPNKKND